MTDVSTNLIVVIALQYIQISNNHTAHLQLIQCYMSIYLNEVGEKKKAIFPLICNKMPNPLYKILIWSLSVHLILHAVKIYTKTDFCILSTFIIYFMSVLKIKISDSDFFVVEKW